MSRPEGDPNSGRRWRTQERSGLIVLAGALGLFLNQTARIAGFNVSLADVILPLLLIALACSHGIILPRAAVFYSLAVFTLTITTALWFTPLTFGTTPDSQSVMGELVKMVVSFLYFIAGYSLVRAGAHSTALRWFAFGAAAVALLSLANNLIGVPLPDLMYYGSFRFRGLMSDPNYYSALAVAALIFIARDTDLKRPIRWPLVAILATSVVFSASKTGAIVLVAVLTLLLFERTFRKARWVVALPLTAIGVVAVAIAGSTILHGLHATLLHAGTVLPQLNRIALLFSTDAQDAIAGQGSGRDDAWGNALLVIQRAPFWGSGVGSYQDATAELAGSVTLAHNTYLQLAAEWGLPLAIVLFAWIAVHLFLASQRHAPFLEKTLNVVQLRDMVLVFLLAGASLSLNNARMFWLFLGMLAFGVHALRSERGRVHSHEETD
ncbi:O-antigen ligase family protein [Paramicrobacterium agarici]|uniref:O-antigen ligase n=1 Tax=Paramicrobacterium agarici TaxID=630514 RepID=A0A2A9DXF2_9MICO|nr:O-antigen ligase family protein [Microbacterium agarici]PFG30672.1 O-antigen ligase [Microbacterium agarici]